MFKGSIVALITPFKNNKLDEDCYISLINYHLKNGTSGLVPAGTTAKGLAYQVHSDLGEGFVRAIDARTGRVIGADHELSDGGVVSILAKT